MRVRAESADGASSAARMVDGWTALQHSIAFAPSVEPSQEYPQLAGSRRLAAGSPDLPPPLPRFLQPCRWQCASASPCRPLLECARLWTALPAVRWHPCCRPASAPLPRPAPATRLCGRPGPLSLPWHLPLRDPASRARGRADTRLLPLPATNCCQRSPCRLRAHPRCAHPLCIAPLFEPTALQPGHPH